MSVLDSRSNFIYNEKEGDFMEVYHGSASIVEKPKILTGGFYKDFGYSFYDRFERSYEL